MVKAKTRRRPPLPITQHPAYQAGYAHGFQTMAELVRDACDLRDVPAADRAIAEDVCRRIYDTLSTALHEIEACGRNTQH